MGVNEERLKHFSEDEYNRKVIAENLTKIISAEENSIVMSLDSAWGTGKTTFITMWKDMLDNDAAYKHDFQTLYFNAWENDYLADPLLALFSEMNNQIVENECIDITLKKKFSTKVKPILKTIMVSGLKMFTRGAFDIEKINLGEYNEKELTELAGKIGDIALNQVTTDKKIRDEFKKAISEYQEEVNRKIIFFIDELDRCRPTFAIELLEIMKHLFNINNVTFVVSLDKEQLSHAVSTIYGEKMDTVGYLRRFFDIDYKMPSIAKDQYINNKYNSIFDDYNNVKIFKVFLKEMIIQDNFSLRDIDKAYYYIKLLLPLIEEFNEEEQYENILTKYTVVSYIYSILIVMKIKKPIIYNKIIEGNYTVDEILKSFKNINLEKYNGNRQSKIGWSYKVLNNVLEPVFELFLKLYLRVKNGESIYYMNDNEFLVGIRDASGKIDQFSERNMYDLKELFEPHGDTIITRLEFLGGF